MLFGQKPNCIHHERTTYVWSQLTDTNDRCDRTNENDTVSPEERQRYTDIIDAILATANLETISRKKIRQGLETSLGGKDLSEQKVITGGTMAGC